MNVATFANPSHAPRLRPGCPEREPKGGVTENRRIIGYLLPVLVIAFFATGCGDDNMSTAPSNTSATTNETWSGVVAPGGQSSRSFTVNASGTIAVTLTAAGATLGLGVGLPRVTGGGCRLGVSINASAASSPQISTAADSGQYCVQVYDLGTLRDPVGFALKIDHP